MFYHEQREGAACVSPRLSLYASATSPCACPHLRFPSLQATYFLSFFVEGFEFGLVRFLSLVAVDVARRLSVLAGSSDGPLLVLGNIGQFKLLDIFSPVDNHCEDRQEAKPM